MQAPILSLTEARSSLTAVGRRPWGAVKFEYPSVVQPSWGFAWSGPGSISSALASLLSLFDDLGLVRIESLESKYRSLLDEYYHFPLLDLDGRKVDASHERLRLYVDDRPNKTRSSGHGVQAACQVSVDTHWLAPIVPRGLFHDNRVWSALNRPLLRELLVGIAELGFSPGPHYRPEANLSPLDAFGFAEVDFEWLKSALDGRWRAVVEGDTQYQEVDRPEDIPAPQLPAGDPIELALFGFDRSKDELVELFDGVPKGKEAAERVAAWLSIISGSQTVGNDDDVLAAAVELRDQLVLALGDSGHSLPARFMSLPIVLSEEAGQLSGNIRHWDSNVMNSLMVDASPAEGGAWAMYKHEAKLLTQMERLAFTHLAAPVAGLNADLSASMKLFALGGKLWVTDQAIVVGANDNYWLSRELT